MAELQPVTVTSLGAQGDGVTECRNFVPGGLPGEAWQPDGNGDFVMAGPASADRIAPTCVHFDVCGGCVAQHMSETLYGSWKRKTVEEALAREGIEADVVPLWSATPGSRRRAALQMKRSGDVVSLGFHERRGHAVFDMSMCSVLHPDIAAALPVLREIGGLILARDGEARVTVTRVVDGLLAMIDTGKKTLRLKPDVTRQIAGLAKRMNARRLVINGEIVAARGSAVLRFGKADVAIPDACFLQAVPEAEAEMQRLVCDGLSGAKKIVDLFCGAGTFTFPLVELVRVSGYDSDQAALDALEAAARHTQGLKPVVVTRRDLFRQPLGVRELTDFDGAIINPPRAGAKAQCVELAASKVRRVVMVSCNPVTFARDARLLIDGGFAMGPVAPIDQFLWSHHVEVVATFTRR